MNHPHELLADLLDGTLGADARAEVEAHLATCAACREDLAAAEVGRGAVGGLPLAEAPSDLRDRILAPAGAPGGARTGSPRWYRWAGAAAAAAIVLAVAVSLPGIGDDPAADRAEMDVAAEGAGTYGAGAGVPLEVSGEDFRERDLERLAIQAAGRSSAELGATQSVTAPANALDAATEEEAQEASGCIAEAFAGQPTGRLIRLIRARFEGRDAYVAIYLEGPGAGADPDLAVVWAASATDCSVLSFAQARL
jgi:hypothetical protein